jgi:hypothetical protein
VERWRGRMERGRGEGGEKMRRRQRGDKKEKEQV